MKQWYDNSFAPTNCQMTPTTNIQSALDELAAKINTIATNRPAVPLQLAATNLPEPTPMPVSTTAELSHDDYVGNHPLDARCQLSSLTEMFQLQAKMLRNLNMMVCELIGIVNLIVAAIVLPNNSKKSPFCTPPTTMTTICQATDFKLTDYFQNSQITPRPPNIAASSHKLAPKSSPYKKTIPAKPPYCHRQTCHLVKTRKDSMRPP